MKKLFYFIFIPLLYHQAIMGMVKGSDRGEIKTLDVKGLSYIMPKSKDLKRQVRIMHLRELSEMAPTPRVSPVSRPISPPAALIIAHTLKTAQNQNQQQITACGFEWLVDHHNKINPTKILKDHADINTSLEQNLNSEEDLREISKNKKNRLMELLNEKTEEAAQLSRDIYECLLAESIRCTCIPKLSEDTSELEKIAEYAKDHDIGHLAKICQDLPHIYKNEAHLDEIECILREAYGKQLVKIIKDNKHDTKAPLDEIAEDSEDLYVACEKVDSKKISVARDYKHKRNMSLAYPAGYFSFTAGQEE